MLIVPKFNLIFVHIPKTGGKSFSRCVQKHYNKLFPNELKQSLLRYDLINNRPMETHSTASEIRTAVGETFYKKANKICFVRMLS